MDLFFEDALINLVNALHCVKMRLPWKAYKFSLH